MGNPGVCHFSPLLRFSSGHTILRGGGLWAPDLLGAYLYMAAGMSNFVRDDDGGNDVVEDPQSVRLASYG